MNKNIQKLSVEEKSLMLANLMGWEPDHDDPNYYWVKEFPVMLCMYEDNLEGLSQFGAIILAHTGIFDRFRKELPSGEWMFGIEPTQEILLDEILRMNGVVI